MADFPITMIDAVVDVTDLGKRREGRFAARNVTLRVQAGDLIGLVGANGGGKTTTLRMLAGLLQPDEGDGHILGVRIADVRTRRRDIGYMSQRLALYPELTVRENLAAHARLHGLVRDDVARSIDHYQLTEVTNRRFAHLSGGWARRVQFAASVIHSPQLLLLDEPTAGLDAVSRRMIWQGIAKIVASGCAAVVSTHDLHEAQALPELLLYHDGSALPQTTPAALMRAHRAASLEDVVVAMAAA